MLVSRVSFGLLMVAILLGTSVYVLSMHRPHYPAEMVRDTDRDGLPDAAELHSELDREAFRNWFCAMALEQWRAQQEGQSKLRDCADLLNFCYREALKSHDVEWRNHTKWQGREIDPNQEVESFHYPNVPILKTQVLRYTSGPFNPGAPIRSQFKNYATSQILRMYNCKYLGRNLTALKDGDLIFFQHPEQNLPEHGMIYWNSTFIYHTGPSDSKPGRVKRVMLSALEQHPDPDWRPFATNPKFLGVYRWNILD